MKVKHKDRHSQIEHFRVGLAMVGIHFNYENLELLLDVQFAVTKLGGKFSIDDASSLEFNWSERWRKYFDKIQKEEGNETSD